MTRSFQDRKRVWEKKEVCSILKNSVSFRHTHFHTASRPHDRSFWAFRKRSCIFESSVPQQSCRRIYSISEQPRKHCVGDHLILATLSPACIVKIASPLYFAGIGSPSTHAIVTVIRASCVFHEIEAFITIRRPMLSCCTTSVISTRLRKHLSLQSRVLVRQQVRSS